MVESKEYIKNKELFTKRAGFKLSTAVKLEHIQNTQKTIKEYREYYDPESSNWIEYIQEFFHLMGFDTYFINPKIGILREFGLQNITTIIFGISLPGEQFNKVVPWLDWSYLLSLLANYHKCQWGLLTSGKEMCIYDFSRSDFETNFFWTNIEGILQDHSDDSFFTIYSIFLYLRNLNSTNNSEETNRVLVNKQPSHFKTSQSKQTNHIKKPVSIIKNDDRDQIPQSLLRVSQVYEQIVYHGLNFESACELIARKNSITVPTVRQDCTAKIHIKAERFCELVEDKNRLISHLQKWYPKSINSIEKLFT